jgi:hypothetical protein
MKRFNGIGDEHRQVFAATLASLDDGAGKLLRKLRDSVLKRIRSCSLSVIMADRLPEKIE